MIKVNSSGTALSQDYYDKINSFSRHFELKLTDISTGTDLDLTYRSASFHRGSCGGSSFAIGCAYSSYIEVTALYDSMLLEGKTVLASIGVLMDADEDTYEWVKIGTFMIQKPVREVDMMSFTAVDAMLYAITGDYTSLLTYPATIDQIVGEIEQTYGVDIVLKAAIGSCTLDAPISVGNVRGVIQALASLSLGYAYVNSENQIVIDYFNRVGDTVDLDFDLVKIQPVMDERATLIDGIKVVAAEETSDQPQVMYEYPTSGVTHSVTVGCPFMTQAIFDIVKLNFVGFTYNGGTVRFMGNPLIEPCDTLSFKGNSDQIIYNIVTHADDDIGANSSDTIGALDYVRFNMACMEISYDFDGGLTTEVTAPGSFEATEETTQPGVLSQLSALESSSGKTVTQYLSNTRHEAHSAKEIADNTNQYFWHLTTDNGSGVGTGAHITEIPQADFIRDPSNGGGNLLARSNGIAVRDGLTELSIFSADGIRLGTDEDTHIEISQYGMEMSAPRAEGELLTDINYMSVKKGESSEISSQTSTLTLTSGSTKETILPAGLIKLGVSAYFDPSVDDVYVNGTKQTGELRQFSGDVEVTLVNIDGSYNTTRVYLTQSGTYTIADMTIEYSLSDGILSVANNRSGLAGVLYQSAYKEQLATYAFGTQLHTSGDSQTVVGKYNENDPDNVFEVGNGTDDANRSNAFSVSESGNAKVAGDLTVGGNIYGTLPIKESWDGSSISVASGSWSGMINSQAFQLDAGVYLAIYHVDFSSNATGYRMAQINTTATGGSGNRYTAMSTAISGNNTRIQGTQLLTPSSTTNYGLYVYQNSGSNLTVAASVRIIKIG